MSEEFDPKVLVEHIDSFAHGLSDWEIIFIADLIDSPPDVYSDRQIIVIERIYNQKC